MMVRRCNGVETDFTFVLQNASIANITPAGVGGSGGRGKGATTPVFLNEGERKRSTTISAKSINLISRSTTAQTSTNVTVVGNQSGATYTIPVTVKADPSKI